MSDKQKLKAPESILNGFFFPNVTHVKLMRRKDGQTTIVSMDSLRKTLKPKDFQRFESDIELTGEYLDGSYHAIAERQGDI
jgi:hypothetical protein